MDEIDGYEEYWLPSVGSVGGESLDIIEAHDERERRMEPLHHEVARLASAGLGSKAIARLVCLTERSVRRLLSDREGTASRDVQAQVGYLRAKRELEGLEGHGKMRGTLLECLDQLHARVDSGELSSKQLLDTFKVLSDREHSGEFAPQHKTVTEGSVRVFADEGVLRLEALAREKGLEASEGSVRGRWIEEEVGPDGPDEEVQDAEEKA